MGEMRSVEKRGVDWDISLLFSNRFSSLRAVCYVVCDGSGWFVLRVGKVGRWSSAGLCSIGRRFRKDAQQSVYLLSGEGVLANQR